ncbi:ubiquinol oxidase subunit II [Nitrospirillum sp. BR 11163]|uniref:ubiquinol oxidase subunit II n=1 Tax=Nitrospirillum sp. BR 11163 TaxID=3104323 RepID=UPI002AFF3D67|nr:ubiquinol oxidase subunit II [Nitrospirillum sp. BR 11163]MEA1673662.1 ubiquinol oxidase subunit II [Nitrospirillum sp. BR 11163]
MARPATAAALAAVLALALSGLTGCSGGVLDPQGPVAAQELTILWDSLGIMLAIVVPTILTTLGVAWWFRAGNTRARYRPDWEYSGRIEMVVWAIPAMTVLLLGGIGWVSSRDLDPPKPLPADTPPMTVQVVSLDWKWLFIYPDQNIASINHLVVPAGTPVSFQLTSDGVMNSFFVPQLGSQIYTMPGMITRLNLQADRPGRYSGISAQFSGAGFPDMLFTLEALPRDAFDGWVANARAQGEALDAAAWARLTQSSRANCPRTFRSVMPGLFDAVANPGRNPALPQTNPHWPGHDYPSLNKDPE